MKLESRIGKIQYHDEQVYKFLTDFNNLSELIPSDKVKDWRADEESCRFRVDMIGETGFKIIEKEPFKLIKISGVDDNKYEFFFWIQLKPIDENSSNIKLTTEVKLNPMLQMMAKKPLQDFLDKLMDKLEGFKFS